jgi:hypothetical protein
MNIVSLESGKTTWLFPLEEILPLSGADGPKIIETISSKYKFKHRPENPTREDADKNGLKFASGQMVHKGKMFNILEFVVFNDGIVSTSTTTESSEAFLQEVYAFLVSEFAFRATTSDVKKVHVSTVIVEFDTSLNGFVQGRAAEVDLIGKHLNSADNTDFPAEVGRIDFVLNKDPEFRPPNIPRMTIEKRAHTQFSQHRYFSSAPIHTTKHLEILETFERGLRKGKS